MFELDMHLEGEIVVISLDGNFEKFNTMEVIEKVEQQIRCQRYNVIFTMEGEKSIDNYGIEALVSSMSMVKVWGGKVVLADMFKPIRDFPQFKSRLGEFEIYDTESEALKHVAV